MIYTLQLIYFCSIISNCEETTTYFGWRRFFITYSFIFFWKYYTSKKAAAIAENTPHQEKKIETEKLLTHAKERLTPQQLEKVTSLENSVKRGDVKNQQIKCISTACILLGRYYKTVRTICILYCRSSEVGKF